MQLGRREFIRKTLSISTWALTVGHTLFNPVWVYAKRLKDNFRSEEFDIIFADLFKGKKIIDSDKIEFGRIPHVAENGAVVPLTISSSLKDVEKISILVTKNPYPLIAEFHLSTAMYPRVSARFKMAETSDVVVIVEANGQCYRKTKHVKVAVGGCG